MDEKETDSHQFILNYSNMDVEKLEGAIEELKSLLWERKRSIPSDGPYAGNGTWTHTTLLPQAPEACASANSTTPANKDYCICFNERSQEQNKKMFQLFKK